MTPTPTTHVPVVSSRRSRPSLVVAFVTLLLAPTSAAWAQRGDASIEWKSREFSIGYGAVRLGAHSLGELPVGGSWRLGNNQATALVTQAPLQVGNAMVAPGGYKLSLTRMSEKGFALAVARAGFALGTSQPAVSLDGAFSETEKSEGALRIECESGPKDAASPSRSFDVAIHYGKYAVTVPAILHGTVPAPGKVAGFALDVFSIPASVILEREKAGLPTPIAALTKKAKKGPESWNVILGRGVVSVRPAPVAPTANYGFGDKPDDERDAAEDALVRAGVVEWAPSQEESAVLSLTKASAVKPDQISLVFACGTRTLTLTLPDPSKETKAIQR